MALRGTVSYIDPQVQQDTRTAQLRVEVPNQGLRLRIGMYVDARVGAEAPLHGILVPKAAVQMIGSRAVVYLAIDGQGNRFVERQVSLGRSTDAQVLVLSGIAPGDQVVTDGVFFLRAEREKAAAAAQVGR
jgi:multidrug efflux pump subunit AcrA (membrane-fusion protein)